MYGCGRCQWWGSKLRITLKGLKCESEVVVAPDEILKGKVMFAMCLNNPDHRQILCSWEDVPVTLPVREMATRAMVAAKVVTGVEEAAIIAVEQPQPRCTPMTGMPSTLVDGEKQVGNQCQPSTLVDGEKQVGNQCQPSTLVDGEKQVRNRCQPSNWVDGEKHDSMSNPGEPSTLVDEEKHRVNSKQV